MSDNKQYYEAYAHEIVDLYNSFRYVGFVNDVALDLTKMCIRNQSTLNDTYGLKSCEAKEKKTNKPSNMLDFKVYYDDGDYSGVSKVYAVDTVRDRFLICDTSSNFRWVSTDDCILEKDEKIDLG